MKTVRIESQGGTGHGTVLKTAEGGKIDGVRSIDVRFRPNEMVEATVGIFVGHVDVDAHPLLDEETLRESAEALGYELVKNNGTA